MSSANRLAESVKPVVEQLEGRTLMSITVSPLQTDSEGHVRLYIRGNSSNDNLAITDDPIAGEVRLVANGVPSTILYPGGVEIEIFDVDLKGGNDVITFDVYGDPINPVYVTQHRSLHLDGDTGNDKITVTIPGGIVDGSEIAVDVDGDAGNDNITLNFDAVYDSKLDVDNKDGDGNDITLINLPTLLSSAGTAGPNYASVVLVDANQGSGKNVLTLNSQSGVYYDGVMDIHVVGGNSTGSSFDTINLDITNSVVEGKMFVNVNALNGDDKINMLCDGLYVESVYRANTPVYASSPTLVVNLSGNDGKDQITATADTNGFYIDETGFMSFSAKGGNGDDKLTTNLTGPMDVSIGGQLLINIDGQNNKDTIKTALAFGDFVANTLGGGGQVTLQILGGQNEDNVSALITDLSTNGATFGPGAFGAVIDGQSNTDKIFAQFTNLTVNPLVKNFESSTIIILP
jgi:hypothetical protein